MTDFLWGIKNGEQEAVEKYVSDKGKDVVNQAIEGRYPLHYAADYGQTEVLGYLISQGADVNQEDKHSITPLLAAVWEGHTECVKLLLKNGANNKVKSPDGTPIIECAEKEEIKNLLQ